MQQGTLNGSLQFEGWGEGDSNNSRKHSVPERQEQRELDLRRGCQRLRAWLPHSKETETPEFTVGSGCQDSPTPRPTSIRWDSPGVSSYGCHGKVTGPEGLSTAPMCTKPADRRPQASGPDPGPFSSTSLVSLSSELKALGFSHFFCFLRKKKKSISLCCKSQLTFLK